MARCCPTCGSYGEVHKALDFGAGVFFVHSSNPFLTDSGCHRKIAQHSRTVENNEISFNLTLYSHNLREWCIVDLACAEYFITNTALYDTLGPDSTKYIFGLTESSLVVCSKDKAESLVNMKRENFSFKSCFFDCNGAFDS